MASETFFEQPREWSERKHRILTRYLKPFCQALSGQTRDSIYYVDCFAGAGSYRLEDGTSVDGSPILAAQVAQSLPYPIKCINVERTPRYFASLVKNTEPYKSFVINLQGDIEDHLEHILQETRDNPALFFLDPFGIVDIPIAGLVEKVAQRPAITDALIRYDPTIVRRLCGRALQDPKNGPADAANLNKIFAGSDWRNIIVEAYDSLDLDNRLLSLYASKLLQITDSRFKFVASYSLRTLEEKLKYFLLFATGNRLGMKIMSEILYFTEEEFLDKKTSLAQVQQLSLFGEPTEEQIFMLKIHQIGATIKEVGITKTFWTYESLYDELILERGWFGRITDKLFRYACKKLAEDGVLTKGPGPWGKVTTLTIKP